MNVVTRNLHLDQTSVAHTHTERNKCDKNRGHFVINIIRSRQCWLYRLTEGWYWIFQFIFYCRYPRAHCTPNKSVPTPRYTRRKGPIYTGPCPKALTECSPLTTIKHLLVSRQFSGPFGVTKYGSGWRNDVVNQCLECALHRDVGTATPPFSGWYGAYRHPIRSVYSAVRFNGSLFLYTPVRCVLVA